MKICFFKVEGIYCKDLYENIESREQVSVMDILGIYD
jgi:hypothetical protein